VRVQILAHPLLRPVPPQEIAPDPVVTTRGRRRAPWRERIQNGTERVEGTGS